MKILFSYVEHRFRNSSEEIVSRSLYDILCSFGEVTSINASHQAYETIRGREFDLFVGMTPNFAKIKKLCRIGKSILIALGKHPAERNLMIAHFARETRFPASAYGPYDLAPSAQWEESLNEADFILCVGNMAAYNSYIKHGVPKRKIKTINSGIFGMDSLTFVGETKERPRIYTFAASEIGLRTGFEIVYHLFTDPDIVKQNLQLHVIGNPTNHFFNDRLNQIKAHMGHKMFFYGGLESDREKYADVLMKSDFVVFPALEGNQEPAVLEAISCGAIPLVSRQTGIDFAPFGFLESGYRLENKNMILNTLDLSAGDISKWKQKTANYYMEYHHDYKLVLEKTIRDCINGNLYPKISITLSIYNKETTIRPLLACLDRALKHYQNAELHIIFDGCNDQSEQVVKQFYSGPDVDYAVTYETTPDIFEIKSNNIGLRKSTGEYCVILQDDNYIHDPDLFFEVVNFMEKNRRCAILGCLSGVNFYPRGTAISGPGQIACNANEVYWRQDEKTDPNLKHRIFEVDACMRGPLFFRKSFLDNYGYLDEIYAPLYQDDMDICFRVRHYGLKVYCILANVENKSLTVANYGYEKNVLFQAAMERNTNIFYSRWTPTAEKDYAWIHRVAPQS